mmetsp:Transcript_12115/g.32173  ORF Transcript_12115/g.32173 Transcript_12115/m.32173 type:complete len:203 (-) Transcript_12115:97-705(-)
MSATLRNARCRHVVQVDSNIPLCVENVSKRVIKFHLLTLGGGKTTIAHCHGSAAVDTDTGVLAPHFFPALNGEAWELLLRRHEMRQRLLKSEAEIGRRHCRLEQHRARSIPVQLLDVLACGLAEIAPVRVQGGDVHDRVAPRPLSLADLLLRDALADWVRNRGMVQVDPDFSFRVEDVPECVLHLHLLALGSGEVVIAHRQC